MFSSIVDFDTIRIIEDHRVGAREVDPETAASRAENEAEDLLVAVEAIHELLSLLHASRAVQAEHVKHLAHLREDQALVPLVVQPAKEFCKALQLSAVELDQLAVREVHL
eukprot:scaffold442_cov268-Pinguiococcus_pyrenoidosus.AAC.111